MKKAGRGPKPVVGSAQAAPGVGPDYHTDDPEGVWKETLRIMRLLATTPKEVKSPVTEEGQHKPSKGS